MQVALKAIRKLAASGKSTEYGPWRALKVAGTRLTELSEQSEYYVRCVQNVTAGVLGVVTVGGVSLRVLQANANNPYEVIIQELESSAAIFTASLANARAERDKQLALARQLQLQLQHDRLKSAPL